MASETITEATSEKDARPRGRPRLFSDRWENWTRGEGFCGKTHRAAAERWYGCEAWGILRPDADDKEREARFGWLCNNDKPRWTLLAELGRIGDPATVEEVAEVLCEWRPTTKAGVAYIRRVRLGKPARGEVLDLTNELITAVNGFMARFPETTSMDVLDALEGVGDVVRRAEGEDRHE